MAVASEMQRGGLSLNRNVLRRALPPFPPSLPSLSEQNFIPEIYFNDSISNTNIIF